MDKKFQKYVLEITTIMGKAVRRAQKKNTELGLPNVYSHNGIIFFQLPDGRIMDKKTYDEYCGKK